MSTQPDQSLLPWITATATVASALVGGLVGVAVTWLAHRFTERREQRRYQADLAAKNREMLRSKLEETVTLMLEYKRKLSKSTLRLAAVGINAANPGANLQVPADLDEGELDKAQALQSLYFPTLAAEFAAIHNAVGEFRRFMTAETNLLAADAAVWGREHRPTLGARSAQALQQLAVAIAQLTRSARQVVERDLVSPA